MSATDLESAVALLITDTNIISDVVNEDATKEVVTPSGNIPSLRKALADNLYFQDPIPWSNGGNETNFNQLRTFTDGTVWWSPSATNINPVPMGASPEGDTNWYPWQDRALKKNLIEELTRFKIKGTFAAGFTYETVDDVGLDTSGNPWSYTGSLPFTVAAGTVPSEPTYKEEDFSGISAITGLPEALDDRAAYMTLSQAQSSDLRVGQYVKLSDYDSADYKVVSSTDTGGFYLPLNSSQKLRIVYRKEYTLEMFGGNGVDDTEAIQGASSINASLNLGSGSYVYKASSEIGTTILPRVIRGNGWNIHCEGVVALKYRDNTYFTGGQFTSDNTFLVDPTVPRSSAESSVMLLTNSEATTNIKMHVDFEYTTASDTFRGEGFVRDTTTSNTTLYDVRSTQTGCIIGTWLSQTGGLIDGKIIFKNCETGLLKRSGMSEKLDLELINTPTQMTNFRNTTDTVPSKNGKDCILSEASGTKTPETNISMKSYYAIERGAYIQRAGKGVFDGYAYGSDVGKCTDDSEGLKVYATAHLVPDGSTEQRYAWQVYGGVNGACKNIDVWPVCHNRTGVTGNKECISVLGECENIVVHEPYGYDLGNGICLVQNFTSGIFAPKIDGLRFIGGRAEGPNGTTSNNGALQLTFNTLTAGNYLRNVSVSGMSAMPAASGNTTFRFNGITERVNVTDVKVDGVVSATDYDQQVVVFNCENATLTAQELYNTASQYPFIYPVAIQRTSLAVNNTQNIDLGNIAIPANPAVVHVELQASHNSQPAGNYIRYEADLIIGGAASQVVEITNLTASSQTLTLTFNYSTGDITLTHQSSSPLGFADETFFARVSSTKEITFT